MAVTATASAVRSSVQAGPWSQSSQIWARRRAWVLGEPQATSCFKYTRSSGINSTRKRLWDMGSSRRQGMTKIVAGTGTGGPPIHATPHIDTKLAH